MEFPVHHPRSLFVLEELQLSGFQDLYEEEVVRIFMYGSIHFCFDNFWKLRFMLVLLFILIALFLVLMLVLMFEEALTGLLTTILATIILVFRRPAVGIPLAAALAGGAVLVALGITRSLKHHMEFPYYQGSDSPKRPPKK